MARATRDTCLLSCQICMPAAAAAYSNNPYISPPPCGCCHPPRKRSVKTRASERERERARGWQTMKDETEPMQKWQPQMRTRSGGSVDSPEIGWKHGTLQIGPLQREPPSMDALEADTLVLPPTAEVMSLSSASNGLKPKTGLRLLAVFTVHSILFCSLALTGNAWDLCVCAKRGGKCWNMGPFGPGRAAARRAGVKGLMDRKRARPPRRRQWRLWRRRGGMKYAPPSRRWDKGNDLLSVALFLSRRACSGGKQGLFTREYDD